jgi:hypothetical protein
MRRNAPGLVALALMVTLAGCFNPFSPTVLNQRVTTTAPTPNSPQNAVKLFEWCWVNRGVDEYRELFTDDYVFISAGTDSAGNASRQIQARRDDEVQTAQNMFIGSADRPPAEQITLVFDQNLVPFPDSRPGKNPKWHKQIRTSVNLKVRIDSGNTVEVTGNALFFLTRGDSAAIPQELINRGFKPDSLRWWIDRWEDETLAGPSVTAGLTSLRRAGTAQPRVLDGPYIEMSMEQLRRIYYTPPGIGP